jgi:hypothetical protein
MNRIWKSRPVGSQQPEVLLMVLHHHLTHMDTVPVGQLIPSRQQRRYSLAVDAPAILQFMCEVKVQLVLHGHQHLRWLERHQAGDPVGLLPHPLWISAAASAGICYPDSRDEHHFQVLEISEDLAGLKLHHFVADARAKDRPRRWRYHAHDPLVLEPCVLLRPGPDRWAAMNAQSALWNSFYQREEDSWQVKQLLSAGEPQWAQLYLRLLAYWDEGDTRQALPADFRDKQAFERTLRATLAALRHDPALLRNYENLLGTANSLSLSQYILNLMLRLGGPEA